MAGPWILGFCVLLLHIFNIHCEYEGGFPPEVSGSYRVMGELSTNVTIFEGLPKRPVQVAFEENYDDKNQMIVYTVWEVNKNETFVENLRTNTTFQYIEGTECKVVTKKDWIDIKAPPSLLGYLSDDKVRFALLRLLTINREFLKESSMNVTYRGLPANLWTYEIQGEEENIPTVVTVNAYWSDPTWNTTAGVQTPSPLGYKITKQVGKDNPETETQYVNVFAFIEGSLNYAAFEAREGLFCEGVVKSEFPFPTMPKMDALSIRSEIALAEYLEVKHLDIWYDMKNKLMRYDMDRMGKQEPGYLSPGRRITSEFTSKELGATFEIDMYKGKLTCEVTKIDDYLFEGQDIINPKLDAKYWDMYHFFGVNSTNYRYIGKTVKRNIPCHVFQGMRTDWPEESSKTISLWEWCLAVNLTKNDDRVEFRDKELPLVSLRIYIRNTTDKNLEDFPPGTIVMHHFYDALAENPNVIYSTQFDISRCFNDTGKKKLQFAVDAELNDTNIHIFENASSNPDFLQLWRDQIYKATKLTIGSLRVAKVRSAIYNKIMFITFSLLDAHPQLPDRKKYRSLADAQKDLNDTINSGNLKIKYTYKTGMTLDLSAQNNSLIPQVDPTTITHNDTTTTTTTTSTTTTSTTKPSQSPVTPTEPIEDKTSKDLIGGHGKGAVAGVSIAMLVIGISLGAGGTFYKYRGLPVFCRRA